MKIGSSGIKFHVVVCAIPDVSKEHVVFRSQDAAIGLITSQLRPIYFIFTR